MSCANLFIPNDFTCYNDKTRVTSSLNASSPFTGALVCGGGAGIVGDLYVGGTIYGVGGSTPPSTLYLEGTYESTSETTGTLIVTGGIGVSGNICAKGSSVLSMGKGFGEKIYLWNQDTATFPPEEYCSIGIDSHETYIHLENTNSHLSIKTGTTYPNTFENMRIESDPGLGVTIFHTAVSHDTSTGALVVNGGVGIAKNLYIGGAVNPPTVSFAIDLTGAISGSGILTGYFTQYGKIIFMKIDSYTQTATSNNPINAVSGSMPIAFRPSMTVVYCSTTVINNSLMTHGTLKIYHDGSLIFYVDNNSNFTNGTTVGFTDCINSYPLF